MRSEVVTLQRHLLDAAAGLTADQMQFGSRSHRRKSQLQMLSELITLWWKHLEAAAGLGADRLIAVFTKRISDNCFVLHNADAVGGHHAAVAETAGSDGAQRRPNAGARRI